MAIMIRSHTEFKKFFHEFFPSVYALMQKYTEDEELARDITQEAFMKLYESREEFETVDNAKAFLYTIARRLYFNHYKHLRVVENLYPELSGEEANDENYLQEVTLRETIRILYAAIDRLPPQSKKIILLNLQGKNNNEVAEELNISVNTVKSLKKSAYMTLRKYVGKEYLWLLIFLSEIS